MSVTIKKGTGTKVDEYTEVFNIGKDWLAVDWRDQSGHWFHGKREAMSFIKACSTISLAQ